MSFFKSDPKPCGMPKQVVLARFELLAAFCGPLKVPKCLHNRLFWDQHWVKCRSKMCLSKNDRAAFGVPKHAKMGCFGPIKLANLW